MYYTFNFLFFLSFYENVIETMQMIDLFTRLFSMHTCTSYSYLDLWLSSIQKEHVSSLYLHVSLGQDITIE